MKYKKLLIKIAIIIGIVLAVWLLICGSIALFTDFTFVNAIRLTFLAVGWSFIVYAPLVLLLGMCVLGIVWFVKKYKSNKTHSNDVKDD